MKFKFDEIFEILWNAKHHLNKEVKQFNLESDKKLLDKVNQCMDIVVHSNSQEFIIDEMPL